MTCSASITVTLRDPDTREVVLAVPTRCAAPAGHPPGRHRLELTEGDAGARALKALGMTADQIIRRAEDRLAERERLGRAKHRRRAKAKAARSSRRTNR